MFSKISEDHIKQAILAETQEAETKWGEAYNSLHEGYAVLKEEVEEANEELTTVINYLGYSWLKIKNGKENDLLKGNIETIKAHAEKLALEAVQVAAVCNKILNGLKK